MNYKHISQRIFQKPTIGMVKLLLWLAPETIIVSNVNIDVARCDDANGEKRASPRITATRNGLWQNVNFTSVSQYELFKDNEKEAERRAESDEFLKGMLDKEKFE